MAPVRCHGKLLHLLRRVPAAGRPCVCPTSARRHPSAPTAANREQGIAASGRKGGTPLRGFAPERLFRNPHFRRNRFLRRCPARADVLVLIWTEERPGSALVREPLLGQCMDLLRELPVLLLLESAFALQRISPLASVGEAYLCDAAGHYLRSRRPRHLQRHPFAGRTLAGRRVRPNIWNTHSARRCPRADWGGQQCGRRVGQTHHIGNGLSTACFPGFLEVRQVRRERYRPLHRRRPGRPDGDGYTNLDEFTFGSNPLDPVSVPAALAIDPRACDFGVVRPGSFAEATFRVWNNGASSFTGTATASGDGFTILSGNSFTIPARWSDEVVVRFAPPQSGPFNGRIAFASNGGSAIAVLSGSGAASDATATHSGSLRVPLPNRPVARCARLVREPL